MQLVRFCQQLQAGARVTLCAMLVIGAPSLGSAQQPVPGPSQPPPSPNPAAPSVAPYRAPVIVLVQPAEGATLPQDKPVAVFRFAQGEPNDLIDLASFAVAVDGSDRTRLFQVTAAEAWGPLAADGAVPGDSALALGIHHLTARICSARGTCGFTAATLTVVPSVPAAQAVQPNPHPVAEGPAADSSSKSAPSRRRRVLDAVLSVVRKLLSP